jgi:hypothetical protein
MSKILPALLFNDIETPYLESASNAEKLEVA